jgi:hypothetical protein
MLRIRIEFEGKWNRIEVNSYKINKRINSDIKNQEHMHKTWKIK